MATFGENFLRELEIESESENFNATWGGQRLNIAYDSSAEELVFTAVVQDQSYLAVGFGAGMVDTDMILWLADGDKSEVLDLWSLDYARPVIDDTDNNINTIEDGENGTKVFTTRRPLDTGDD